jgi:hypothetical protein
MDKDLEALGLIPQPADRRRWLLQKALESLPLDQALDLARKAEAFVTDGDVQPGNAPLHREDAPRDVTAVAERRGAVEARAPVRGSASQPRTGLALSPEQRERLLERIAKGANNADLAAEFGLSPRQVQGIRMGSARDPAKRRDRFSAQEPRPDPTPALGAYVEDVVRFLRQQDDIVVPVEKGEFLVNARFRMPVAELVARANRMRSRQGKTEFTLSACEAGPQGAVASGNGHDASV